MESFTECQRALPSWEAGDESSKRILHKCESFVHLSFSRFLSVVTVLFYIAAVGMAANPFLSAWESVIFEVPG